MAEKPEITFLICTAGRRPKGLRRTVRSILRQTVECPIIVIHNHRRKFKRDPRFRSLRKAGPIYEAFNFGVKAVKTPWICKLDDDDYLQNKNFVKRLQWEIIHHPRANYVCHQQIPRLAEDGEIKVGRLENWTGREKYIIEAIIERRRGVIAHSGGAWKKSLFDICKYPIHFRSNGDTYWQCELASSGKLHLHMFKGYGPIIDSNMLPRVSTPGPEREKTHAAIRERWGHLLGEGGAGDLTIIIPTKGERWVELERCLSSIDEQTAQPGHIIIVHNHKLRPPRYISSWEVQHLKAKGSLYAAFNAGVRAAKTAWVMFVEDRDRLPYDTWLAGIAGHLRRGAFHNYIYHLVIPTERGTQIKRNTIPSFKDKEEEIANFTMSLGHGIVSHSGAAYLKSLHKTVGPYPTHLEAQGDAWWVARAALENVLRVFPIKGDGVILGERSTTPPDENERARTIKLIGEMVERERHGVWRQPQRKRPR